MEWQDNMMYVTIDGLIRMLNSQEEYIINVSLQDGGKDD